MYSFVSFALFFFFKNDVKLSLKTKNLREKLTFDGAEIRLELRSPMFGETCISKSMSEFGTKTKKSSFFVRGVVKNGMCED